MTEHSGWYNFLHCPAAWFGLAVILLGGVLLFAASKETIITDYNDEEYFDEFPGYIVFTPRGRACEH